MQLENQQDILVILVEQFYIDLVEKREYVKAMGVMKEKLGKLIKDK